MKKSFLTSLLLIFCYPIIAQSEAEYYSLQNFTPKLTKQDGANCYAYSAAYVALTTQIAKTQNQMVDSTTAFSFGFVDGFKYYLIKQYGIDSLNRAVNHEIYKDTAEIIGNLDYVFYILKKYGTVKFSEFPYTNTKKINKHFQKAYNQQKIYQKIISINEIFQFGQDITPQTIEIFKAELRKGKPIICSIEQRKSACDWGDISSIERTQSSMGNHIVTIIGFNNNKFIIKNNYQTVCINEYLIKNFLNMLGWAYTYNL